MNKKNDKKDGFNPLPINKTKIFCTFVKHLVVLVLKIITSQGYKILNRRMKKIPKRKNIYNLYLLNKIV